MVRIFLRLFIEQIPDWTKNNYRRSNKEDINYFKFCTCTSTSITGGQSPYTYVWNSAETTADISGKGAGTYDVTVTDTNGCTGTQSISISEPTVINLSESHLDVTCYGASDGNIDLNVSGGTGTYTF